MKNTPRFRHFSVATFLGLLASSGPAMAGLIIDQDFLYYSGSLAGDSTETTSRLLGGISVGASIPKAFQVGWNVNIVQRSDGDGSGTSTLSGTEMGPRFGVFLGKGQNISIAFTYHPLANATYTAADGTTATWQGSGFQGEIAYLPQVSNKLFVGIKLIYDSVTYSKSTDASNTTSTVSYTLSTIVPTVSLSWRF